MAQMFIMLTHYIILHIIIIISIYDFVVQWHPEFIARNLIHIANHYNIYFLVPSPPIDVRLTSIVNNNESTSVTIEWDPLSQGGSQLNYTITTTPDLITSGPPPVTTSTSTTITINYNTDYTITITASNCVGNGITSDELQFNIGMFHYNYARNYDLPSDSELF